MTKSIEKDSTCDNCGKNLTYFGKNNRTRSTMFLCYGCNILYTYNVNGDLVIDKFMENKND